MRPSARGSKKYYYICRQNISYRFEILFLATFCSMLIAHGIKDMEFWLAVK